MNLERLISRSLSTPRKVRLAMRRSIMRRPSTPLRYTQLVDHLATAMIRAYTLGYRSNGASLRRESRTAQLAHYKRMAREALTQYQTSANIAIRESYQNARARGASVEQSKKIALRRHATLGHVAPASNRLAVLYRSSLNSAHQQGIWDSTVGDGSIWGYRWRCREARVSGQQHPTTRDSHWLLNRITLPKDHEFWRTYWPLLEFG